MTKEENRKKIKTLEIKNTINSTSNYERMD